MNNLKRTLLAGFVTFSLASGALWAQAAHAASPATPTEFPGEEALPPVDTQLHVPMGPPAGTPASKKPVQTRSMPFNLALEAANAALASCGTDGYSMAVAITDDAGHLIVAFSPDGAAVKNVYDAIRKDQAALAFKVPTSTLRNKIPNDPSLLAKITPNMAVLPGAMPIMVGDRLVGAIATSGGTGYEEEKCDQAGIDRIKSRLK